VPLAGHAVEARLYAEDPAHGFLPSTGRVLAFEPPAGEGIRVAAGLDSGSEVTPYYDPMIAKLIATAPTRLAALDRLADALDRTVLAGPRTNVAFLAALARAPEFRAETFDTGFIDRNLDNLIAGHATPDFGAAACGVAALLAHATIRKAVNSDPAAPPSPWDATDGFQLGGLRTLSLPVVVDGEQRVARVAYGAAGPSVSIDGAPAAADARVIGAGDKVYVLHGGRQTVVEWPDARASADAAGQGGTVRSPMHGKLLALFVEPGADVRKGQRIAIIEAMKMEHALVAPVDGRVAEIAAVVGAQVAERAPILVIEPAP
jgi:3-methylcrotonyl-CoA carboxylase alpha subunit